MQQVKQDIQSMQASITTAVDAKKSGMDKMSDLP